MPNVFYRPMSQSAIDQTVGLPDWPFMQCRARVGTNKTTIAFQANTWKQTSYLMGNTNSTRNSSRKSASSKATKANRTFNRRNNSVFSKCAHTQVHTNTGTLRLMTTSISAQPWAIRACWNKDGFTPSTMCPSQRPAERNLDALTGHGQNSNLAMRHSSTHQRHQRSG